MESFEAHWGVPGGISQTIVGSQFKGVELPCPPRIRHELHLDEQGRVILYEIEAKDQNKPIILLAHGMGGCSESGYMKRISTKLWMQGYGVFLINHHLVCLGTLTFFFNNRLQLKLIINLNENK